MTRLILALLFLATPLMAVAGPYDVPSLNPDTGQRKCYDADGDEIHWAGTAPDVEYIINPRSYTKLDESANRTTAWQDGRTFILGDGCTDADSDGVPDIWDDCPDTPVNSLVDSHGCVSATGILGDINADGKIDLKEAIYALQVVAGLNDQDTHDNSFLTGAWIVPNGSGQPYILADGNGNLLDIGGFNMPSPAGTYQVNTDGSIDMTIGVEGQNMSVTADIISSTQISLMGDTYQKVGNLSSCEGTWDVTIIDILNENTSVPPSNDFTIHVDSEGNVTSITNFNRPATGKFFCTNGGMSAHISTSEPNDYKEISFYGTIVLNFINGYALVDNGESNDPDLQVSLTKIIR